MYQPNQRMWSTPPQDPATQWHCIGRALVGQACIAAGMQACKFWLNTGTCLKGDTCPHMHAAPDSIPTQRSQWIAARCVPSSDNALLLSSGAVVPLLANSRNPRRY